MNKGGLEISKPALQGPKGAPKTHVDTNNNEKPEELNKQRKRANGPPPIWFSGKKTGKKPIRGICELNQLLISTIKIKISLSITIKTD